MAEAAPDGAGHLHLVTLTAPGDRAHRMPSGDWCPCTPQGGVDLARWNATASKRWNRLRTAMSREYEGLEYFRAAEVQRRGALHFHLVVWSARPLDRHVVRRLAVIAGFGHEADVRTLAAGSRAHARYVSKYVTKACDQRETVPWVGEIVDVGTGEIREARCRATYRTWAASRGWGTTMRAVRLACARAAGYSPRVTPIDRRGEAGALRNAAPSRGEDAAAGHLSPDDSPCAGRGG
ncbi:MAG TPA: hypothetical protein VHB18_14715 [Mycobacteriales bacterium]|nr:hypothetical protein [Mycobacteriales bacterium]